MYQPPILPEDTQPRIPTRDDTQPNPIVLRRRWWKRHGRWLLLAVIGSTSLTLILTLALLLRPASTKTVTTIDNPSLKSVTLNIGGEVETIQSGASTIADVLEEQNIALPENDTVSPPLDNELTDGMTVTINRARDVTLIVNGDQQTLNTPFENPLDIINSAGITLADGDEIWVDGTKATLDNLSLWTVPAYNIEIVTAVTLTIIDGGQTTTLHTTAGTVGDALFEAGLTLYLTDSLSTSADAPLTDDMTITIDRATPIELLVDGVMVSARTNASTVEGVLAEMNSPLFGLDYVVPSGDTPVTEGMTIEIVRVTEEVVTETETVSYEVTYQPDETMTLDEKVTVQAGQNGTAETRIRVRYENGIEVERTVEGTTVTQSPVNEVVAYGTNIVLNTVDTPEGARQYWRKLRVYATSYHPEALGGDDVTAIGATLQKGIIGADPRIIPWRTEMFVPGYGVGMMADTGGARSSRYWIDLGYSDADWVAWHEYVDVYLLTPIPDEINYLLPEWTPLR